MAAWGAFRQFPMILLAAIIIGLLAGFIRARLGGRTLASPSLRLMGLVPLAFLPQWLAFYFKPTRTMVANKLAAIALIGSQILLLAFSLHNYEQPGFKALSLGLALNLMVIVFNDGLMPISPDTLSKINPDTQITAWPVGYRLGTGKNIVLATEATQLPWLSDRFLLPSWSAYQVAFSLGDILIAGGAFWLLWTLGKPSKQESNSEKRI